jgi:hypothetical protein
VGVVVEVVARAPVVVAVVVVQDAPAAVQAVEVLLYWRLRG